MVDVSQTDPKILLLVDDEKEVVRSLRRLFRKKYSVVMAESAEEACLRMREKPAQVIISDQRMPGMTGAELFYRLKKDHPDTVRILLTGYSDIEAVISAVNDGDVFHYLGKPWEPTELETVVQQAFEHYRLVQENRKLVAELQKANETLEQRVADRTAELVTANRILESEIDRRKQVEMDLRSAKRAADMAAQAKSRFLATMSHEIRTPMNAVIGFTEMLMDTSLNEEQADYGETIKKSGEALLTLINDILDFSRVESGEMELDCIEFDPELLAYDVCHMIRLRVGSGAVEILCRIDNNLPSRLKGDPGRLRQVIVNLMGNASKFTEEGEIELCLQVREEREDRLTLHVMVRDTGIGISGDKLESIFEPFRQLCSDGSTTRRFDQFGGRDWVSPSANRSHGCWVATSGCASDCRKESEPGRGSRFHFTAKMGIAQAAEPPRFETVSLGGKKALIVDDNQSNLDILRYVLEMAGIHVTALNRSSGVVDALKEGGERKTPYDFCIIDIQMPEISGYGVAEGIRKVADFKALPLIALSSVMQRDARRCAAAGFDGFLNKPLQRKKLFQMLRRIFGEKWQTPEQEKTGAQPHVIMTQYSVREDAKRAARILLAEDNPVNQKLAKIMLSKAGYQVTVVENGKGALEKVLKQPQAFDLVLMDVMMPEMDGLEATRSIRDAGFNDLPIIAMTAGAMEGDRARCMEAGMNDYMSKPVKRELVYKMLEKWVFDEAGKGC